MKDIAQKLWTVRRALVNARYDKQCRQTDLTTREAELTLVAQGKNAEERKASLALLMRADNDYQDAVDAAAKNQHHLESLEAEEAYLLDLRRAHEWHVRLQMASALAGKSIASDGNDPDAQGALDDAQVDRAFTPPTRPGAGGTPLPDNYLDDIELPARPAWQMPAADLAQAMNRSRRNAPIAVSLDDDVPF